MAAVIADVTREKLVQTDADLGPAVASDTRKVAKIVQALSCEADALIAEMEQELAEGAARSADPETMRATRGAEVHLLRGLRSIVMAEMLRRVT